MVVAAQQNHVGQVGTTSGFPSDDVVHDGEGHVAAARVPAVAVPADDLSSLGT
jgi:hypothetical protein